MCGLDEGRAWGQCVLVSGGLGVYRDECVRVNCGLGGCAGQGDVWGMCGGEMARVRVWIYGGQDLCVRVSWGRVCMGGMCGG